MTEELEEINITEKQKVKELEIIEMTDIDVKLVHEEEYDEIFNSNIVAENKEPTIEILITENSLTDNIEIEGENPERDKQIIGEQDKVHKITEGPPLDNRNTKLQFERTRLKEIKIVHNAKVRRDNKQEGRFKSSAKVYVRQQRSVMAFHMPRSTVHIHYNPWRILGLKNINFGGDEIFKFGNEAIKYKKLKNIDKTKIQKYLTNKN